MLAEPEEESIETRICNLEKQTGRLVGKLDDF